MAVGAPTAGDLDHQDLSPEPGIHVGYMRPFRSGKLNRNGSLRSFILVCKSGVGGLRKALGPGGGGAVSGQFGFAVLQDI